MGEIRPRRVTVRYTPTGEPRPDTVVVCDNRWDPAWRAEAALLGDVDGAREPTRAEIRAELGGKNLACWHPLSESRCHVDELLRIANSTDPEPEPVVVATAPYRPGRTTIGVRIFGWLVFAAGALGAIGSFQMLDLQNSSGSTSTSGSRCKDGWSSPSRGPGTCSHHGGVDRGGTSYNSDAIVPGLVSIVAIYAGLSIATRDD